MSPVRNFSVGVMNYLSIKIIFGKGISNGMRIADRVKRLGTAVACKQIAEIYARLNTNDESCPNHFIQYGALEALKGDQSRPQEILRILKERRNKAVELLN